MTQPSKEALEIARSLIPREFGFWIVDETAAALQKLMDARDAHLAQLVEQLKAYDAMKARAEAAEAKLRDIYEGNEPNPHDMELVSGPPLESIQYLDPRWEQSGYTAELKASVDAVEPIATAPKKRGRPKKAKRTGFYPAPEPAADNLTADQLVELRAGYEGPGEIKAERGAES